MKNKITLCLTACFLTGCGMAPSKPVVDFQSENSISLRYSAYGYTPTVSAEAIDMAAKHCSKHGKGFKLVSSNAAGGMTTQEIHTFMCTNDFTDGRIEIKVK